MCTKKECKNGWVFTDEGVFVGRCECSINQYVNAYFKWSEVPKEDYKKTIENVNDYPIYFNVDRKNETTFKKEIEELTKIKDILLRGSIIGLKGKQAQGKTQFAITLALELFKQTNFHVSDDEIEKSPFLFLNLSEVFVNNTLFDSKRKQEIIEKAKLSKILILDELGDELLKREDDKRLPMFFEFFKILLDRFDGLIIYTTNNLSIEEEYKKTGRLDIVSRLFGEGNKQNYFTYGFSQNKDLREEENAELASFKNRFN